MGHQLDLLEGGPGDGPRLLERPGLRLRHWRGWLDDAPAVQAALMAEVPWRQERITLWGRSHPLPRLTCWMADPGCAYAYSGLRQIPQPWSPTVASLRARLEAHLGCPFNSLLLNLYRDGRDRMGWHADDEPDLEREAPIASLSLGAARAFHLRPQRPVGGVRDTLSLELDDGDLLVMDPPTQEHWQHQLPLRRRLLLPRINLTFRVVRPS
ncbi:MAG: alpha-ketoglutarate-dependent dioxygenase AlkB family protein [Cyanobium sp.]